MNKFFLPAILGMLASFCSAAQANPYPDHAITLICTEEKGTETDINTRLLSKHLGKSLGVPIVVKNEVAEEGKLAINKHREARPDGYTLFSANTAQFVANQLLGDEKFDSQAFTTVAVFGKQSGENIVVPADSDIKNIEYLLSRCKSNSSSRLKFGVAKATNSELLSKYLTHKKGCVFEVESVALDQLLPAVLDRKFDLTVVPYALAKVYFVQNKLRNIATLRSDRLPDALDAPTMKESGMPELSLESLFILLAPKQTDLAILEQINAAVQDISRNNEEYRGEYDKFNFHDPYVLPLKSSGIRVESQIRHTKSIEKYLN